MKKIFKALAVGGFAVAFVPFAEVNICFMPNASPM